MHETQDKRMKDTISFK